MLGREDMLEKSDDKARDQRDKDRYWDAYRVEVHFYHHLVREEPHDLHGCAVSASYIGVPVEGPYKPSAGWGGSDAPSSPWCPGAYRG